MLCFRPQTSALLIFHLLLFLIVASNGQQQQQQLQLGFYSQSCPVAEVTVRVAVKQAVEADKSAAARLLRLSFHDCFVEGCDGSILLETGDGERQAPGNAGLGGFNVIETAKSRLESLCPGVVSCADILALAARDAVALSNGPNYDVPTGRRDGRVSSRSLANNLPDVNDPIEVLTSKFRAKGVSIKDFVLLSAGGHTIGTTACFFMPKRLYNFTGRSDSDPALNPQFLPQLKSKCPPGGNVNDRLALDWSSEFAFDDHILGNILNGSAVLASDARLVDDRGAKQVLESYVGGSEKKTTTSFGADFAEAMVRMGNIEVKTGSQGEIRKICSKVN
ncbi:unnamed protein product [Linum trigynum]|uniref:Peroxidase n=1 Tax=Linum trigynum TaxID=586398 RepID=A0AAV2D252_9ROSI